MPMCQWDGLRGRAQKTFPALKKLIHAIGEVKMERCKQLIQKCSEYVLVSFKKML